MRAVFRPVLLVLVGTLAASGGVAEPEESDWAVNARFRGEVVGMTLDLEKIPTLPVGFDPRYQMKVRVLAIHEGSLPVETGKHLAFLIHSPSLFFMRWLGEKPLEFEGFIKGPFEFIVLRKAVGGGRFAFDLRIEPVAKTPKEASQGASGSVA